MTRTLFAAFGYCKDVVEKINKGNEFTCSCFPCKQGLLVILLLLTMTFIMHKNEIYFSVLKLISYVTIVPFHSYNPLV